ncbi:MAG: TnsA endonuclease N-terminal domain-containing protein [Cyclobacteriaceae bacterium]|jgi:hypothetical protein|nr:TnsA endonuclease N-terminal domain-containing protein [Cyclobacteriaceae bacterium]
MRQFKPVRKIGFSHRSITGIHPTFKNEDSSQFESSLESDFITILNFDFCVQEFIEQPLVINFKDENGARRIYTPDFLVKYKKGFCVNQQPTIFEVKYRKDLFKDWKILKPKFKAAISYASENNMKFKIITEKEIRTAFLFNAKFLWKYKHEANNTLANLEFELIVLTQLQQLVMTTPNELILSAAKSKHMQGQLLHTLWKLVAKGSIGCDLNSKLNMNTEIWHIE